jgi:hypothetical protein
MGSYPRRQVDSRLEVGWGTKPCLRAVPDGTGSVEALPGEMRTVDRNTMKPAPGCIRALWACLGLVPRACISLSRVEGYRPDGPGTPEPRACSPVLALRVALDDDAAIIVEAVPREIYPDPYLEIRLDIRILLSGAAEVQLLSSDLWLESGDWPQPSKLPVVRIVERTERPHVLRVDDVMHATEDSALHGYVLAYSGTGSWGRTSIPASAAFRLQLPGMRVNCRRIRLDAIHFERYTEEKLVAHCD